MLKTDLHTFICLRPITRVQRCQGRSQRMERLQENVCEEEAERRVLA